MTKLNKSIHKQMNKPINKLINKPINKPKIKFIVISIIILIVIVILIILYKNNISNFENNQLESQKCHFITYGDDNVNCKSRILDEAEKFEFFNSITAYGPEQISQNFYNKHKNVFEQKRGGGYWIWKYDIILQKLNEINDNDILVYTDCGCTINKDGKNKFYEYIKMLNESPYGIISLQMNYIEREWTTKELFNILDIDLDSEIAKSGQYTAAILIMKKSNHLMQILNKCIEIIDKDNKLITDFYNNNNQESYFKENRHDQSILSLVRKKYNSIVINDYNDSWNNINDENKNIPFIATRKK